MIRVWDAYLRLHVLDAVRGEDELVQRHLGLFEVPQEPELAFEQEEQALADLSCARCTPNAVDVVARVIWWVVLYDVVYAGDINAPRSDVGT